ncbi:MAG TPA: hypothetical protein VFT95_09520 [Micromonosporaceae bacterium]|nr:hypothetical protein [Micromonosporaceae bacterium]
MAPEAHRGGGELVIGLRRRPAKAHARLLREELSESLEHFMQAANHAAGGVNAAVSPRMHAARERVGPATDKARSAAAARLGATAAALAPIATAAKNGGRRAVGKKPIKRTRRWPRIATLLAAGAAVGAAGAFVLRHRRRQQWEEYDPSQPVETTADLRATYREPETTVLETPSNNSRG